MRADAATGGQGVILVTNTREPSTRTGKRRYKMAGQTGKPHSDRSAKEGQMWNSRSMRGTVPASSMLTHEEIQITITGERTACPDCGIVPQWDCQGDLVCECRIWAGPNVGNEPRPRKDLAVIMEERNANYQRDMRRFFKSGRRG